MGDAATPTLPNFTNQTASVYKANIDAGFAVADRLAWAFAPHQQDQGSPAPDGLHLVTQWRRTDDGGLDDIRTWIAAQANPRLVIVDTFEKLRGNPDRDRGVYRDDYQAIGVYKALADQTGVPVLVIHHVRKAEASDPLDAISGTAGLTGSCDTVLVLKRESGSPYATIYVRGRDVQETQVALQFEAATGRWLKLGPAEDFRKSQERKAVVAP